MKVKIEGKRTKDDGPTDYKEIARNILGNIDWQDSQTGYCLCPGHLLHRTPTGSKDTRVSIHDELPPTIHCFHDSCNAEIERANALFRSELGKADARLERNAVGKRKFHKSVPKKEDVPNDTERFLSYCFDPEDYVSIEAVQSDGKPGSGMNHLTCRKWIGGIDGDTDCLHPTEYGGEEVTGYYVRINPIKRGSRGTNDDVTNYRYILLESDNISKEKQEKILRNSGLPIAALIDSGGKSIHAWVHVDAINLQQYHQRRQKIYDSLPEEYEIDGQCKNPSRYSRLPGAFRGDQEQKLLGLGIGPRDYEAWEDAKDESDEGPEFGPRKLLDFDVKNDPNNLLGERWLCKGMVAGFVGPTGAGKSTLIMQAMMNWGLGKNLFGIKTMKPLKSYMIQYENDDGDLAEQFQGVSKSMDLTASEHEILQENLIFRTVMKHVGMDFGKIAQRTIERHKPDILWVDPISMYIGGDLSDAEYVTEWLAKMLVPLAKDTGTIIMLVQHTGKATMDAKTANMMTASDMAYKGFGSSIIANTCREMINLAEMRVGPGVPRTFRLDLCKRRSKAGMRDYEGHLSNHVYMQHSQKNVSWELCKEPETPKKGK